MAAAVSYQLHLRSIDYALKRYIDPDEYENEAVSLGDKASDLLKTNAKVLVTELRKLHTQDDLTFGKFGAEITLFKVPDILDVARMISNRGLLLEVLPLLRLSLEMISWAGVAFYMDVEADVIRLNAHECISKMKLIYESAGRIYGYLSRFSHWKQEIHQIFLKEREDYIEMIRASSQHRATSLALCLVILDVLVEVVRKIYPNKADGLIVRVQGVLEHGQKRKIYEMMKRIVDFADLNELRTIQSLLR